MDRPGTRRVASSTPAHEKAWIQANTRDDRAAVYLPSARHYVGDVTGKSVLDFGCGDGVYARLLMEWGAASVVGIDPDGPLIEKARDPKSAQAGITYLEREGSTLELGRTFDQAVGFFVLHYAESVEHLHKMVAAVGKHLKPGGTFVGFNSNPNHPFGPGMNYDVQIILIDAPLRDGSRFIRRSLKEGVPDMHQRYYSPQTYEAAFRAAGFEGVEWPPFVLSPDADPHYAKRLQSPLTVAPFRAVKRRGLD